MTLFFRYWVWVLAHMGLIFYLSSQSVMPIEVPPWVYYYDKVVHAVIFGFLSLLFLRAWLRGQWRNMNVSAVLLAIVFTFLYGVSDEFHQQFVPGRQPSVGDVVADTVGAIVVALVCYVLFCREGEKLHLPEE